MDLSMLSVDKMMKNAVSEGVFPGGSLLVSMWGKAVFRGDYGLANIFKGLPVGQNTIFDLASLTKPLATSLCMMKLVHEGTLGVEDRIGSILKRFHGQKKDIRIIDLLCHRSGFLAHRPFYEELSKVSPGQRKKELCRLLVDESLDYSPGERTLYSDLGFMILRWIIEEVSGKSFKECFEKWVIEEIGLKSIFFYENGITQRPSNIFAATEDCPFRKCIVNGQTHDLNAYFSGGYDGHAGLFSSMDDVSTLLATILGIYRGELNTLFCNEKTARLFLDIPCGYDRALGFDVPSKEGSSSGKFFSGRTVGHLGYTGTSFWMDLKTGLSVILLTNRVHPNALNISIRGFRPLLHDCVVNAVFG